MNNFLFFYLAQINGDSQDISYGNHYATIVVEKRKELDKFENTHTVYNGQTASERAEKSKKEYCGNGKEYVWEAKKEFAQNQQEAEDSLPF